MADAKLVLERRGQEDKTGMFGTEESVIMLTPPISDDYWAYRVVVADGQAIVGFPKFGTIGIGFAVEEDWNTNLPYSVPTADIWNHIRHNKGSDSILDEDCLEAIRMIQEAILADRSKGSEHVERD